MKKTRNLLLLATLFVSIFAFAVTANARAWGFSRAQLVCNPEELEAGGSADCYYFGIPSGEVSTENAGFYTRMYSTDNLVINDVVVNSKLSGAKAIYVESASLNEAVIQTASSGMPSKLTGFRCVVEPASGDAKSTGCGIFYSVQASADANTKVFKAASMTVYGDLTTQKVKTKINTTNVAVLGHIKVSLPEENDVEACGNLCIASYAIGENNDWDRGDCTNNAGTSEWSGESCEGSTPAQTPATQGKQDEFDCFEIKLKQGNPQHVPESGAFVSYAILAAGALIAISAVTIAKKHNRIQKI